MNSDLQCKNRLRTSAGSHLIIIIFFKSQVGVTRDLRPSFSAGQGSVGTGFQGLWVKMDSESVSISVRSGKSQEGGEGWGGQQRWTHSCPRTLSKAEDFVT